MKSMIAKDKTIMKGFMKCFIKATYCSKVKYVLRKAVSLGSITERVDSASFWARQAINLMFEALAKFKF